MESHCNHGHPKKYLHRDKWFMGCQPAPLSEYQSFHSRAIRPFPRLREALQAVRRVRVPISKTPQICDWAKDAKLKHSAGSWDILVTTKDTVLLPL